MKIDLSQQIRMGAEAAAATAPASAVAMQALFHTNSQIISRDKSKELYDAIEEAKDDEKKAGKVDLPVDDLALIKKCVDSVYSRGVSWQFAEIVEGSKK